MLDVSAFSFQPRWLWRLIRIGASINDFGDVIAKLYLDIAQSFGATAIFHRIMEQRADRFGFICAVLKRDGSHAKNVRDERNSRFLARLISVRARRINQSFFKLLRQLHYRNFVRCTAVATALCAIQIASCEDYERHIGTWLQYYFTRGHASC